MKTSSITVDLGAISENFAALQKLVYPARIWSVVKGDGYGFGLERVVEALLLAGADRFVVHDEAEAMRVRGADASVWILCLSAFDQDEIDGLINARVGISVGSFDHLQRVQARAMAADVSAIIDLETDTGLSRGGFPPDQVSEAIFRLRNSNIKLRSIWTHLSKAGDSNQSQLQLRKFLGATSMLCRSIERHVANSRALNLGRDFFLDSVRPGLALYGLQPSIPTRTCYTWRSYLTSTFCRPRGSRVGYNDANVLGRDSVLGIVPVGFADGYPRLQKGVAFVRETLVPILGPVCMISMILDLTDVSASPGDEVVLVGYPNPSIETIVGQSTPHTIPNLFSCVRTASTKMTYLVQTHRMQENLR